MSGKTYFDADFVKFFKELAKNNNRDWFNKHKKRYESVAKQPFEVFVGDLIKEIAKEDKKIDLEAKDAIFRINRDVRFSKDKSPYKIQASAVITPGGRKDYTTPGVYLELTPTHARFYGGAHYLEKQPLLAMRQHIAKNLKEFRGILEEKKFKQFFGKIHGESHKRVPPEFQELAGNFPLIANKQFYYFSEIAPEEISKPGLIEKFMERYFASKACMLFMRKAIKT